MFAETEALAQFLTAWAWQTCLMWASSNQALRWQLLFLKSVLSLETWTETVGPSRVVGLSLA